MNQCHSFPALSSPPRTFLPFNFLSHDCLDYSLFSLPSYFSSDQDLLDTGYC